MKYVRVEDIQLSEEEYSELSYATIQDPIRVRWQAEIDANLVEDGLEVERVTMRRYGASADQALNNLINALQAEGWGLM